MIRKILLSDKLNTGWRLKYNETVDDIVISGTVNSAGKLELVKYNNQKIIIDLTSRYYTETEINQIISDIQASISNVSNVKRILSQNKSSNYNISIPFDSELQSISFKKVSGNPIVKVGTTLGGEDIMESTEILFHYNIDYRLYFQATGPIYISVSGGTVHSNAVYFSKIYNIGEIRTFSSAFDITFN